ncbi:MAG: NADH:flavin oxidoreductase/NADH oxidase [Clostridia bacterium]|nr:NADH:flavin oxidoreductase/NADH oxidase [Clostridia bacterium]
MNITKLECCIAEKYHNHTAFLPVSFRHITLPGRIVRSATELFCSPDGHVAEKEITAYEKLAKEPFGLIISAHTCVSPEGRANPGQNAIWDDIFIEEQSRIAAAVHNGEGNDSKIILQLGHGGMKAEGSNGGRTVYTPDNMTVEQIKETVKAFANGAIRAKACGFDGIQLHAAHMYLLSQFFYPQYNHRTDLYGGNGLNRFRIIREITEAVKAACGDDFPVFIKINGDNLEDGEKYFEELCEAAKVCEAIGMEGLELSGYNSAPAGIPKAPYFFETAKRLMTHTDLPLMLVGGIRKREEVEEILASGIKTVSFSRPVLQNVEFIRQLFS